jgi:PAS domain S-box-containing protein
MFKGHRKEANTIEMPDGATSGKSPIFLALLIVAGFLGNYYAVSLFFGADFLFGSIAVLLILNFYGLRLGIPAAVIVHGYTYFLWGHPYGFVNFIGEAFFVGMLLKRGYRNLLVLDWLFWVFLGMPLAWLFFGAVMHMDSVTVAFIMLKEAINGIFNALIASLAISYLPLGRLFQRLQFSPKIAVQTSLFNLLVLMALVPALALTMLQAKQVKANLENGVMTEIQSLSTNVQFHLRSWHQLHLQAMQTLASMAGESSMTASEDLQHKTEILKRSFPDFRALHVEDADGHAIVNEPKVNENGESTVGADFSNRAWFQEAKAKQRPLVSEVFVGRAAVLFPIVDIIVPVIKENRWLGCSTGSLDLGRIQQILQLYRSNNAQAGLTLIDPRNRVITSTNPGRAPMQSWNWKESGMSQVLDDTMNLWSPDNKNLPSMTRWTQSYYVQETPVGSDLPWKLTIEAPLAPLQKVLYGIYVKNLTIMACLTTLGLFLSYIFSRAITRPLAELAQVSADLPEKLSRAEEIDWPASSSKEIDLLVGNFMSMAGVLEANFHRLREQSDGLRQTAEALSQQQSYLTAIIENQPGLLWLKDSQGRFLSVNHVFSRSSGRKRPEDVIGKMDSDIWPAELAWKYRMEDREVMTRRAPLAIEERIFKKGVVKWMQVCKTPVFTEDGHVLGTCGFALDVTERKRAEEALQESEERYRQIAENIREVFWISDPDLSRMIYVSPAYERVWGKTCESLYANPKSWVESVHRDDRQRVEDAVFPRDPEGHTVEYRIIHPDGSIRWVLDRSFPVRNAAGEVYRMAGIAEDVTERKLAEADREMLEGQLRQAQKLEAIGTLAGGIAHDFNNILAIILGYTEMTLMDIPKDTPAHRALGEVLRATLRAKDLVQQILTFSRQGKVQARQPMEIAPVIRETLKLLRAAVPATIEFRQQISANSLTIMGEPTQLHQIVVNLCTNAAHAMRDRDGTMEVKVGEVLLDTVSAKAYENLQPGSYVQLTVRDTGHGMDAATLERIFDPYFTTKKPGEGSGLGLAVVHGIVNRHDGVIRAQSMPGQGTLFEILIPRIEDHRKQMEIRLEPPARGTERILLVDDEEQLAALGKRLLDQLGYHVTAKTSSLDAIELFRSEPDAFDLVITDYTMPHMTGMDLAGEMLQVRPEIRVILCTGYSEMVSEETAKKAGIIAFAMKPLDLRSLADLIREVLDKTGR